MQHGISSAAAWVAGTLAVLLVASIAVLAHAMRLQPTRLHWDTQRWHLGNEARGDVPLAGRLVVAMDLGGWMLLYFVADDAPALRRGTWLPVQRRGHEAAWHALALYGILRANPFPCPPWRRSEPAE